MKKTHFFFRVLTLFFAFSSSSVASQTDPNDVAAMQSISKGLDGATSLGWTDPDPCTWAHVSCSINRVTAIQIGNQKLQGNLSPFIRNLTGLLRLELMGNQISGELPSFNGMSSLQVVLLHNNKFQSIPIDFFDGLTGLVSIDIDQNPFSSWVLPESLKSSAGLVNFSAVNTNLTGKIPDYFGDGFPSFEHLSLSYNLLSGGLPLSFSGSSIKALWLNNQRGIKLSGSIDVVQNMSNLVQLWLHSNSFSGPLPDFTNLESLTDLELRDNQFTGPVPRSLIALPNLHNITLTNNLLQGPLPVFSKSVSADVIGTSNRFCVPTGGECDLRVNDLLLVLEPLNYPVKLADDWNGNNPCDGTWTGIACNSNGNITVVNFLNFGLNGTISPAFSRILSLQKLLLGNNFLTGEIPPELTSLKNLVELDVSNNLLKGHVPAFDPKVKVTTKGNVGIGRNDTSPGRGGPSGSPSNSTGSTGGGTTGENSGKKSGPSVGIIVGGVIGGVCVVSLVGLLGFCFYRRQQQPFGRVQSPNTTVIHPRHSGSDPGTVKITVAGSSLAGGTASETYSRGSSGPSDIQVVETGNMVISIQVLRNVTNNFSEENILGRGGFGTVYKGELHDGTKIAVKRMESGVIGGKGLNEFTSEIAVLTKVRHRHLVALLGYCLDGNERLLVYEYMPQGTLSRFLFNWKEEGLKPLEWMKRLSIALDVARGVEYLHGLAHQSFIHRDLKPSNILLGDDMRAKVADFGLVRLAPDGGKCSVETRLAGTFGYLAPEYAVTGRVTTKADVFSFGVILMELLTGRRALDETQSEESVHLVTWFRRMQINKDTFRKAIDPTIDLDDDETVNAVNTVADLAGHCCAREPYQRPDMGHAVTTLSTLVELWKPSDPDAEDIYGIDLDMTLPQALKKWQAFEDTGATSSFLASMDNTQTSIPTRPSGFADSFTSADGR